VQDELSGLYQSWKEGGSKLPLLEAYWAGSVLEDKQRVRLLVALGDSDAIKLVGRSPRPFEEGVDATPTMAWLERLGDFGLRVMQLAAVLAVTKAARRFDSSTGLGWGAEVLQNSRRFLTGSKEADVPALRELLSTATAWAEETAPETLDPSLVADLEDADPISEDVLMLLGVLRAGECALASGRFDAILAGREVIWPAALAELPSIPTSPVEGEWYDLPYEAVRANVARELPLLVLNPELPLGW